MPYIAQSSVKVTRRCRASRMNWKRSVITSTCLHGIGHLATECALVSLHRAEQTGLDFLQELSRRPQRCPHATPAARVLEARRHHPTWGPRQLLVWLRRQDRRRGQTHSWPARSTVAELLKPNGLTVPRRWRSRRSHPGQPLTPMTAPNVIWTADYKGQFRVGEGRYCFPLTMQDGFSRYLLACRGLTGTTTAGRFHEPLRRVEDVRGRLARRCVKV